MSLFTFYFSYLKALILYGRFNRKYSNIVKAYDINNSLNLLSFKVGKNSYSICER